MRCTHPESLSERASSVCVSLSPTALRRDALRIEHSTHTMRATLRGLLKPLCSALTPPSSHSSQSSVFSVPYSLHSSLPDSPYLRSRIFGKVNAISFGLLLHAASIIALGKHAYISIRSVFRFSYFFKQQVILFIYCLLELCPIFMCDLFSLSFFPGY